jgi:two-component system sensor histidine kinase KdpD
MSLGAADLQSAERALRRRVLEEGVASGWPGARLSFRPLSGEQGPGYVLGYSPADRRRRGGFDREQAIEAILAQCSLAIERAAFARQAGEARRDADREALRSALLSSLSHDLRTPLATILGAVTSLRTIGDTMPAHARRDLLLAIEEEAGRLSRYVENLLQMTRLQAGVVVRRDWIDIADIAHAALERARRAFPARRLVLEAGAGLPLVAADAAMIEQALFNMIENAIKFSPSASDVRVRVHADAEAMTLCIEDEGTGIPADKIAQVFEPFFRADAGSSSGAGLGLAIAKGVLDALGWSISIRSPRGDLPGTVMTIRIPLPVSGAP